MCIVKGDLGQNKTGMRILCERVGLQLKMVVWEVLKKKNEVPKEVKGKQWECL